MVAVEVRGLELFGRHGVNPEEREHGQLFRYDVELEVGERALADELASTIDYREVVACVRAVSDGRAYALLEALAGAVAAELIERFRPRRVRVTVAKPQVELDAPVACTAATVELP